MSKVWKWILGILIVLVVAAVVVGGIFLVRNRFLLTSSIRAMPFGNGQTRPNLQATPNAQGTPNPNGQKGQVMPYGFNNRRFPMDGQGFRGPMMGGRGFWGFGRFMPFGMGLFFIGGFLRLILPLGVLALVAFLFYQMGKRAGSSSVPSKPSVPSEPAPDESPLPGRKVAKN
jgi:hypothetical protein